MSKLGTILLPAAVFQSVIVGGAYGTGREVVEFISSYGALGGLKVLALIAALFAVFLALSFEFARGHAAWDYRSFLKALLGRGWILYELLFVLLLIVILAIVGAAAGQIVHDAYRIPPAISIALLFTLVVVLNYFGREAVKNTLALGAVLLTIGLVVYLALALSTNGSATVASLNAPASDSGWSLSAAKFAIYNSALIPVIVYCASNLPNRRSAILAGVAAGLLGVLPGLALHLSFMAYLPTIVNEAVPTLWVISTLELNAAIPVYVLLLFATLVQTGVGVLQGLNERLDGWYAERTQNTLPGKVHALVAGAVLLAALVLSKIGIVALIAEGYGTLAWGFFVVFTLPLVTIGAIRVLRATDSVNLPGELQ